MKNLIKKILMKFNIGVSKYDRLEKWKNYSRDIEEILSLSNLDLIRLIELRDKSKS